MSSPPVLKQSAVWLAVTGRLHGDAFGALKRNTFRHSVLHPVGMPTWRPGKIEDRGSPDETIQWRKKVRFRRRAPGPRPKPRAPAALIAFQSQGRPAWTPRDYAALAREGFAKNAIVYRSVQDDRRGRGLGAAASSTRATAERDRHPLLALLARPNRRQAGADFREALYGYLLVAGNAYVEAVAADDLAAGGLVRELHALRPDRMKVMPGADGWPEAYEYTVGGRTVRFADPGDAVSRRSCICRSSTRSSDHYGFAPIEAAAVALDVHNAAGAWNKALLDNSARPSGALVYQAKDGGNLSAEQFERLKAELETELRRRRPCRPAAAPRRRARLEGDGAVAEGHGLHGGQERRRPRDRARLRRAADAPRHSRRQHLFELPGGQPRLLARHRAAAGRPRHRGARRLAGAGLRRAGELRLALRRRPGRRALRSSARRSGRGSPRRIS